MLSYRHLFHAGNHGDVLKHLVLMECIEYLKRKDKPLYYLDTHAGAGLYDLASDWARKNREYESGIGRLWGADDLPGPVAAYMALIRRCNPDGRLHYYPGSAWIAQQLLRPDDRLRWYELQSDEYVQLSGLAGPDRRVKVSREDGFTALRAVLPVPSRRALVLVDPAYELKEDYRQVTRVLKEALARCAGCTFLVWYPVVTGQGARLRSMLDGLRKLAAGGWLRVEVCIDRYAATGMAASGLLVVNPPWTLTSRIRPVVEFLSHRLAPAGNGAWTVEPARG